MTTFMLAWDSGRWIAYLNFLGLMLAYSAAIVSLGLALATWQSRLGRAVALSVGVYVVFAAGWPALIIPLTMGPRVDDEVIVPLMMGTPLYGTALATLVVAGSRNIPGTPVNVWTGCFLWIAIHGGVAGAFYEATVATFDRPVWAAFGRGMDTPIRNTTEIQCPSALTLSRSNGKTGTVRLSAQFH